MRKRGGHGFSRATKPRIRFGPRYEGDFEDPNVPATLFYWMSSNAIDKNQVVGYEFNIGSGSATGCSGNPCYPSVYADTLDAANNPGTLKQVQAGSADITDAANHSWGEIASVSMAPDGLTFWGVGEYLDSTHGNESACSITNGFTNCTWLTTVFSCQKGSGVCP